MKKTILIVAVILFVWNGAIAQRTLPLTLRTMVQQAGTIVHGVVAGIRTGKDPATGMLATWVTLDVRENFYGAPSSTITFKQVGGEADGMAFELPELPGYTQGEEVVLLLYPPHPRTGFSSPVGMGQGKFEVKKQPAPGKKLVEQITPSARLLKSTALVGRPGSLGFDELADELRSLVRAEKGGVR